MKRIVKSPSPKELTQWLQTQQNISPGQNINCRYGDLTAEIKAIVKQQLLKDQGYLCCLYVEEELDSSSRTPENLFAAKTGRVWCVDKILGFYAASSSEVGQYQRSVRLNLNLHSQG